MKTSVILLRSFVLVGLSVSSVLAAPFSLGTVYSDRQYWELLDWSTVETSTLWRADPWRPFAGQQDEKRTFLRSAGFSLLGFPFEAHWTKENDSRDFPYSTSFYGELTRSRCAKVQANFVARFGPGVMNDGTIAFYFGPSHYVKLISSRIQWDFGSTRINAGCFGSVSAEEDANPDAPKFSWSMRFSHVSRSEKEIPNFVLQCTRKAQFNHGGTRDMEPLIVWIDLNRRHVKLPSFAIFADDKNFAATDDEISFVVTAKQFTTKYSINRISGSLSADITDEGKPFAKLSGTCEKSETVKRKF